MNEKFFVSLLCIFLGISLLSAQTSQMEGESELYNKIVETYKNKDYESCVNLSDEYLTKYPTAENKIKVKLYKGVSYIKLNKIKDAIAIFEEMDQSYPDYEKNDQIKYLLGKLYYEQEEYEKSKQILNELITKYPNGKYSSKAVNILDSIQMKEEQEKIKEMDEYQIDEKDNIYKEVYSFKKITWAKICAGGLLIASPIFYLTAKSYENKADSIYENEYKNATTSEDAVKYYNQVDDYESKAATYKNLAWISLVAGIGFFAVDYFYVGRVTVKVSEDELSFNYRW